MRESAVSEFRKSVAQALKNEVKSAKADCFSGCVEIKQGYISGLQAAVRIMNTEFAKNVDN